MKQNRILYLMILLICAVLAYYLPGRLVSVLLAVVLCLPILSTLLSLGIFAVGKIRFEYTPRVTMRESCGIRFSVGGAWPSAEVYGKMRLISALTGEQTVQKVPGEIDTNHCGAYRFEVYNCRMCDYLGLVAVPLPKKFCGTITVLPAPLEMAQPQELARRAAARWKAKPGGGFGENYDLRPYRPGDQLQQIHWKMTAKTGTLMYRETLIPEQTTAQLLLELRGTAEEIDRKVGRLLWLGEKLTERQIIFDIRALTGDGVKRWPITNREELLRAVSELVAMPCALPNSTFDNETNALWRVSIGGEPDEA